MSEVEQIDLELQDIEEFIKNRNQEINDSEKRIRKMRRELETQRNKMKALKAYVWKSIDPDVVRLRNELLMVVKLLKKDT